MNVLFLTISTLPPIGKHSISLDLIHEFIRNGHNVYAVGAVDKNTDAETNISEEAGCTVLRVKIGKNKKANLITKGITTLRLPHLYKNAIKKYFSDAKFDLVLYPTPPVTHVDTVKYIKKRDGAKSYLMLKDIFPQNAVDIGMMTKSGLKGIIYKKFRKTEKKLYSISDHIGCMSQANVDYVLKHNPEVDPAKVEICPNAIEICDMSVDVATRNEMREKYGLPLDKKIFVYGGNLSKPQGIPFFIDCLRSQIGNEDAYFLVVGDGTDFGKLQAFFDESNPSNMKLLKKLPKEDYDRLVAACDVGLVFLDHRFTIPNFPSRILSYMQAKLPVLACTDPNTDIGKVIEGGKFGLWCESNNVAAFGEAVKNMNTTEWGENGYKFLCENYSVENSYKTIMDFIEK